MSPDQHLAAWLVAVWTVGHNGNRLPTTPGLLDSALMALFDNTPDLPAWLTGGLRFADTPAGPRCLDLPAVLQAAEDAGLLDQAALTSHTRHIRLDSVGVTRCLEALAVPLDHARAWGQSLRQEVDRLAAFS